jgi:hypothetical protein
VATQKELTFWKWIAGILAGGIIGIVTVSASTGFSLGANRGVSTEKIEHLESRVTLLETYKDDVIDRLARIETITEGIAARLGVNDSKQN